MSLTEELLGLRSLGLLRERRERQTARLGWHWQDNACHDPCCQRNELIHGRIPNVKGWWMSSLLDNLELHDGFIGLTMVDARTGAVIQEPEREVPALIALHNEEARRNRERLILQQRLDGARP